MQTQTCRRLHALGARGAARLTRPCSLAPAGHLVGRATRNTVTARSFAHSSALTATTAPFDSASAASSQPLREAEFEEDDASALAKSYYPFGALPSAFPLQGFPLARVAFGGTPRPGNNAADASATVKSYVRLGGNLLELTRGFSFAMIDSLKELIQDSKGSSSLNNEIVMAASVSAQDVLDFLAGEQARWKAAQTRGKPPGSSPPTPFVSQLLPAGVSVPKSPRDLLPLLPRVLPLYLSHFLSSHELDSLDVLLLDMPLLNANPGLVPDAAFDWMGGVDKDLTNSEDGFVEFASKWFEALESMQRAGVIKSYGINSARFTLMPPTATPTAAATPKATAAAAGAPTATASPQSLSQFYVPLDRILAAARAASAKAGPNVEGDSKAHHLSTLKFPFSLFSAHRLLYPSAAAAAVAPASSSAAAASSVVPPSFFSQTRAEGLLCLGDQVFEDVEPLHREWVRFAECPALKDPKVLLKNYKEAMAKVTNLEYVYKLLVEESKLPASHLPARIPDLSWGSLLHAHQNDLWSLPSLEHLVSRRIRPSLAESLPKLKAMTAHPKLQDWATRYQTAAPEACKQFQIAVEHSSDRLNEKINEKLVSVCPRLASFPSLEEKCLLILLSTPIDTLLTDQLGAFDVFAQTVARIQENKTQEAAKAAATVATTPSAGDATAIQPEEDDSLALSSILPSLLLTPAELRATLDLLQTDVAPLLPASVMADPARKKKPATIS